MTIHEHYVRGPFSSQYDLVDRCMHYIARYIHGYRVYIGITNDPERRFYEHQHGNRAWATDMVLLWASDNRDKVSEVEEALIDHFKMSRNQENVLLDPGFTENIRRSRQGYSDSDYGTSFVYILTDGDPRTFGDFSPGY